MRCESCGRDLPTTANFCGSCGTGVSAKSLQAATPAASLSTAGSASAREAARQREDDAIRALQRWGQADRERAPAAPASQLTYRRAPVAKVMSERVSTIDLLDRLATVFKGLAIASVLVGAVLTIVVLVSLSRLAPSFGSILGVLLLGALYTALAVLTLLVAHATLRALAAITVGVAFSDDERAPAT